MIAVALALVLSVGKDGSQAVAWADRLLAASTHDPSELYIALDAYRQVAKRFPHNRAAWFGQGKSLEMSGCYGEASECFRKASRPAAAHDAGTRLRLAAALDKRFAPATAIQIEHAPARGEWIVLLARRTFGNGKSDVDYKPTTFTAPKVALVKWARGGDPAVLALVSIHAPDGAFGCWLLVTDLEWRSKPAAIVWVDNGGADHDSNAQYVVGLEPGKLRFIRDLYGDMTNRLEPATRHHGLRIVTVATFKVWWPDVYEWAKGAFRFANRANAALYREVEGPARIRDKNDRRHYWPWMTYAARLDIEGRFTEAKQAWRRAAALCRRVIEGDDFDIGYFGSAKDNLRDIQRRLRWLAKGEYGHWLLYRAYDFDLQLPPYRLGNARPVR